MEVGRIGIGKCHWGRESLGSERERRLVGEAAEVPCLIDKDLPHTSGPREHVPFAKFQHQTTKADYTPQLTMH